MLGASLLLLGLVFTFSGDTRAEESPSRPVLRLSVRQAGRVVPLREYRVEDLRALKQSAIQGRAAPQQDSSSWQGVLITDLINPALEASPEARSFEIDLVVLKSGEGARSILPRSFINKYPIVLALKRNGVAIADGGPIRTVVANTGSREMQQELLPVESYFVPGLVEIELANYRQQFPSVFLKNRSDPRRMRGERLFVKTCMGCHGRSDWPMGDTLSKKLLGFRRTLPTHDGVTGMPPLGDREQAGLKSYFDAVRQENPDLASGEHRGDDKS
ncbi:MAG: cytochrome c [Bdellovibrionales bacterium]|nr:cytochrome c [Bdellovibrionales bacterium]